MAGRMMTPGEVRSLAMMAKQWDDERTRTNLVSGSEGRANQAGTGVVKTLFNIMDQPKSAVVGTVKGLLANKEDEEVEDDNPVVNMIRGLTGKKHYTTADILQEHGVKNGLVRGILGFGGDIALDPLTYMGVERVKGITPGTAGLQAGRELTHEALESGQTLTREMLLQRADDIMQKDPSKWDFKFGLPGKRKTISVTEPGFLRGVMEPVMGPEANRRAVFQGFSRSAEQPYGMDIIGRNVEGKYTGIFQEQHEGLKKLAMMIPETDQRHAALRYENPDLYENKPLTIVDKHKQFFDDLEAGGTRLRSTDDLIQFTKEINKKLRRAEMERGHSPDLLPTKKVRVPTKTGGSEFVDRPVAWDDIVHPEKGWGPEIGKAMQDEILANNETKLRKIVKKPDALALVPGLSRSRLRHGQTPNIQDMSFEELVDKGAQPIIHIGESTLQRLASSYRRQTRAAFVEEALQKFGIDVSDYENASEVMQHLENADIDKKLRFRAVQPGDGPRSIENPVAGLEKYKNYYLPDDIAFLLNKSEEALTDHTVGAQLLQKYDRVMSHWKALNSLLSPGYFARTTVGDVLQNTVAGVTNPKRYAEARAVVNELQRNRLSDIVKTMSDPDLPLTTISDPAREALVKINIGGRDFGSDEINRHFVDAGAMSGQIVTEQTPGAEFMELSGNKGNIPQQMIQGLKAGPEKGLNLLNRVEAWAGDRNVGRETRLRMTNFINKMDEEISGRLRSKAKEMHIASGDLGAIRERLGPEAVAQIERDAASASAKHVRKYNIDYGALTKFERNTMRRIVPFYSWYRRNFPQQMVQVLSNPGFMNLYPKSITAMQNILGTDDPSDDWQVPDWIRESLPVRIAQAGAQGNFVQAAARFASGAGENDAVFMPYLQGLTPLGDVETTLQPLQRAYDVMQEEGGPSVGGLWAGGREGMRAAANMTTPAIRAPFEMASGRSTYSGGEIKNWNDWLAGQAFGGPGRQVSRGIGIGDQPIIPGVISYATGIQLQRVDQQRQKGEYQRRKDVLDKRIESLKEAMGRKYHFTKETAPKLWENMKTDEIMRLQNYLKYAGRSVGY